MLNNLFWTKIIYILSGIISLIVAFLILGPRPEGIEGALDVSILPLVNAALNGTTTILLILGFILIKQKKREQHRSVMLSAFGMSCLFLVTYVIYHWFKSGPKLYMGDFTTLYYFILITHILLAVIIIPLALFTLYRGWTSQLKQHRKIARITLPIWLYVSITGVIIYLMLY
jgi:putative membrane protein